MKPLAGLEAVSADLIGQRLHVKYDAAKLTTSAMVDAVGETGMRMWLEHEEPMTYGAALEWRWKLMIASGLLLGAGALSGAAGFPGASVPLYIAGAVAGIVYPIRRAITAARSRTLDINVLMVVAVAGAMALGDWLEATTVVFLFAIAQWLEVRTMERARQAIRAIIDLAPRDALVRRNGRDERVAVDAISPGDEIVVRPGEKIPLDGVVLTGHSDVNEAPLTGESRPIDKGSRARRSLPGRSTAAARWRSASPAWGATAVSPTSFTWSRRRRQGARRCSRSSIDSRGSTRRSCWR